MPCAPDRFTGSRFDSHSFRNWLGNVNTAVSSYFEPDSLEALVWVVQQAHRNARRLKVVGSGWSFEDIAACPDWMVDLRGLHRVLSHFTDETLTAASPLTLEWQRRITRPANTVRLVQAEAGIVLFDLNRQLHDLRLAMPTLGGSQGQTLAGAISTSTHGGDVGQTPFPDIVRAVHLVTTDGQEIWVESASEPLTTDAGLRTKLACADVQIVRDDELLSALQVSVGRFGVIYSYVLEVRTRFDLVEWATPSSWGAVSALLREGIAGGDFFGPLRDALPRPTGRMFEGIRVAVGDSDINPRPRYLEFLINPRDPNQLWVRRRWELEDAILDLATDGGGGTELIDSHNTANWILKAAASLIRLSIPTVAGIPGYGIGRALYMEARAVELDVFAHDHEIRSDFALVAALNALWACDEWGGFGVAIDMLVQGVFDGRPELAKDGKRGVSWQVMSGLSAGDPAETRVNSIEMIFDATTTNYIDFMDFLGSQGHGLRQAGYVSVRYSRKSDALLSMHNVEGIHAVSIEVASLVGFEHNDRWMRMIEARGIELGGRPHWGQHNTLQSFQVSTLYGENVRRWRDQLVRVVGTSGNFSNNYTEQRGLEPFGIVREVTAVRRAGGRITHLVNPGAYWSPMPVEEVIRAFEGEHAFEVGSSAFAPAPGRITYLVRAADPSVRLSRVIVVHVLTTSPDDSRANNLRELPMARELYLDVPPPMLLRRRVTSVVRNRWGGITALCNDEERWRVLDTIAFFEISRSGIEYVVDRGGTETLLLAKTHVATFADGVVENNLDSLPDG
jgi:FAD/FMN-containing dehydrogenase